MRNVTLVMQQRSYWGKIDSLAKKDLHKLMKDALVTATAYLVNELLIKMQVVFDAKFLYPKNQQARSAPGAISRLTRSLFHHCQKRPSRKNSKSLAVMLTCQQKLSVVNFESNKWRLFRTFLLVKPDQCSIKRKETKFLLEVCIRDSWN